MEALMPFVTDNFPQDPKPFPYLQHEDKYNFDINLIVDIKRKFQMKEVGNNLAKVTGNC